MHTVETPIYCCVCRRRGATSQPASQASLGETRRAFRNVQNAYRFDRICSREIFTFSFSIVPTQK